jgi:hypothetical protein
MLWRRGGLERSKLMVAFMEVLLCGTFKASSCVGQLKIVMNLNRIFRRDSIFCSFFLQSQPCRQHSLICQHRVSLIKERVASFETYLISSIALIWLVVASIEVLLKPILRLQLRIKVKKLTYAYETPLFKLFSLEEIPEVHDMGSVLEST